MEKLGVEKQELKQELMAKYASIKEKLNTLEKLGSPNPDLEKELNAVKQKIEELE